MNSDKKEALNSLKLFLEAIQNLPPGVRLAPVTHNDLCAILEMIIFILDEEKESAKEE